MLARVHTFALDGMDSRPVVVEADIRLGLPSFTVVGLADKAVRESRERVRSALLNSGFEFPQRRITINLAPASVRKVGPSFDLGIAVSVLVASEQVPSDRTAALGVCGELSLGGGLRPVRGVLALAEGARASGLEGLVVAEMNAGEAALVEGLDVLPALSLVEVVAVLTGELVPEPAPPLRLGPSPWEADGAPDLADVRGHHVAKEALVIAAAGRHNALMHGPPGTGKTMLARRLPSILPPLTHEEALAVTRIHSIAGHTPVTRLSRVRPFRAPHHTISPSGLVGGDAPPRPGEVSLAHHGVLFLDELSEFPRHSLESLRQPLEDGRVAIVRGQVARIFPSRFILIAASNPCPCGLGPQDGRCRCDAAALIRFERRLSGPLLDRIDLQICVERPTADELAGPPGMGSAEARERVLAARERQADRYRDSRRQQQRRGAPPRHRPPRAAGARRPSAPPLGLRRRPLQRPHARPTAPCRPDDRGPGRSAEGRRLRGCRRDGVPPRDVRERGGGMSDSDAPPAPSVDAGAGPPAGRAAAGACDACDAACGGRR